MDLSGVSGNSGLNFFPGAAMTYFLDLYIRWWLDWHPVTGWPGRSPVPVAIHAAFEIAYFKRTSKYLSIEWQRTKQHRLTCIRANPV
jgi:hypothetical protein